MQSMSLLTWRMDENVGNICYIRHIVPRTRSACRSETEDQLSNVERYRQTTILIR